MGLLAGCEITGRHWTYPTNLAQRPIEKRFLLLNGWTKFVENLFFVKPKRVTKIVFTYAFSN